MAPKAAKQVLPPNPPADETRTLPLAYTSFHPPPFVNAKNVSSSYLKTEAQTWVSRSHRPTKRPKTGADGADGGRGRARRTECAGGTIDTRHPAAAASQATTVAAEARAAAPG